MFRELAACVVDGKLVLNFRVEIVRDNELYPSSLHQDIVYRSGVRFLERESVRVVHRLHLVLVAVRSFYSDGVTHGSERLHGIGSRVFEELEGDAVRIKNEESHSERCVRG